MTETKSAKCESCGTIPLIPNSRIPENLLYPSEPRPDRLRHLHQPLYTPANSHKFEIDHNEVRTCKYDEYPFPPRAEISLVIPVGDILDAIRPGDKVSMWIIKSMTNRSLEKFADVEFHNLTSKKARYQVNSMFRHVDKEDWFEPIVNGVNERVELIYDILGHFPEEVDAFCGRLISNWSGDQFLDEEGYRCTGYSDNIQSIMINGLLAMCKFAVERAYNQQNIYKILQIVHWLRNIFTFSATQHGISKIITLTGRWQRYMERLPKAALEEIVHNLKNNRGQRSPLIEQEVKSLRHELVDWRAALLAMFWVCLKGVKVPETIRHLKPLAVNVYGRAINCDCQKQFKKDHSNISDEFQQILDTYR